MGTLSLIVAIGLGLVFVVVMVAVIWQEIRGEASGPVYVINDAVAFVVQGLGPDVDLGEADVLRILEYEIFYMQGLAQEDRKNPVETVAGGVPASVDYIGRQIAQKHGAIYSQEEIERVLSLEAGYLAEIGALGAVVQESEEET
jgi:hypothetical protein